MNTNKTLAERIKIQVKKMKLNTFTAKDFIELGNMKSINKSLERMYKNNEIGRIITGVYDIPKYSEILEEQVAPSISGVAQALARANNWKISPSGIRALNYLALSTQVPAKYTYVSSGPYKTYSIGNVKLVFKHTNNRLIYDASEDTTLLIQAIKALGRDNVTDKHQEIIRKKYDQSKINTILDESKHTTAWIYETIKKIFEV